MSIDPKALPDGTAVTFGNPTGNHAAGFVYNGKVREHAPTSHISRGDVLLAPKDDNSMKVLSVLVPVPAGISVEDAEKALAALEPADPDADLIERMAQTIADNLACEGVGTVSPLYRDLASKALAVVREAAE